ncbi:MAG: hypothetical protein HYS57_01745, partial [Parcubacteria group bacterium]|nr:hypothetical protein [Parcubacteria group bacterium]
QVVPSRFSSATQPPVRGSPLWVVGFAGGRAPRVAELAMNFEDVPGRYQFQFGEFPIARVWMMDVVSGSVAGMSGGFVYNSSGLVVGLYHGHFSVQQVPVLATATPGPLVGGWVTRELEKLGVRL